MNNVVVLFGGRSSEYEVSLSSAYGVLSNIDRERFSVSTVGITKEGRWYLYEGNLSAVRDGNWWNERLPEVTLNLAEGKLCAKERESGETRAIPCDVVLPILHGACGEDGTMQGLFAVCGIPVVGCGCTASAVCMDKALTKAIVEAETKIAQAKAVVAVRTTGKAVDMAALREECEKKLSGYPLFVKPACSGSSVGASKVHTPAQFAEAVSSAFREGKKILIEECIAGVEAEVAILEEKGILTASLPAEIDIGSSDFYDYETKYVSDASSFHIPARIPPAAIDEMRADALSIFRVLGCRGLSRVDFFYTKDGRVVFNEINTIPGFTPISMYPRLMMEEGLDYPALITRLIESAL